MVGRNSIVGRALARQTFATPLPFAWHAPPTVGRALARQTFATPFPFAWHAPPTVGCALARHIFKRDTTLNTSSHNPSKNKE
ncbi:hypothetical protein CWC03_12440 [Pseudoalteromonas sp. S2755]|nr:hypothetical protein CWC03_12440 [Pseudoalteromonas sp. S2755]